MTDVRDSLRTALEQRLRAALHALGSPPPADLEGAVSIAADRAAVGTPADSWLVYVAFTGQFPLPAALARFRRELLLAGPDTRVAAAIAVAGRAAGVSATAQRTITIVSGGVLVDVGHSATSEHNTGIQRVVRRTLPHWGGHPHTLVAWTAEDRAYRELDESERERVLSWGSHSPVRGATTAHDAIVVPWQSSVVLPEVATPERCEVLACLAEHSGSRVALIGYDAIPLVSADLVAPAESERFARYLTVVKHSATVAGISRAASAEFEGFCDSLAAQGLRGPRVCTVSLADDLGARLGEHHDDDDPGALPVILSVGSHEPRKNQQAVLDAASLLHAEGHRFRLVFVGGGSRSETARFDRELGRLNASGMHVESHRRMEDGDLFDLFARARFSVFTSLHEGYGLPVVESLSHGTPVVTSNYGSLEEIALGGGCLMVDPRSVSDIARGIRTLLEDEDELARLREQIASRTVRTWEDYAEDLWNALLPAGVDA